MDCQDGSQNPSPGIQFGSGVFFRSSASPFSYSADRWTSATASTVGMTPTMQNGDIILVLIDGIIVLQRQLGSAVLVSTRTPYFPPAAAISPNLRSQILAGPIGALWTIGIEISYADG